MLAVQHDAAVEQPQQADLNPVAVRAVVKDRVDRGRRGSLLVVEGLHRVQVDAITTMEPFLRARIATFESHNGESVEADVLAGSLRDHLKQLAANDRPLIERLENATTARLADLVAAWVEAPQQQRVNVLIEPDIENRLQLASDMVKEAKARAELKHKVDSEVRRELSKSQKELMLRQQLRAIQKELGELGEEDDPLARLKAKLVELELPDEARTTVDRELRRLDSLNAQSPEANVIRTYLEVIADLPWNDRAPASQDLDEVERRLEEDHFGLQDVKRRILEHMAVLKLAPQARGTVLALVGPPGVGKTSLAQSVADATGRPLVRVSLGGVRDEAEIRGHRRTYVGALPGRIIAAIRKAGVKNPVVVLDEVDKVTRGGWSGDPEAALLEVLDPEQNSTFTDHYLELPFDLSEVFFIATANQLNGLSLPLRDRLEVIEVSGYTVDEKVEIARRHLLPSAIERHGLSDTELTLSNTLLGMIARDYTREAGVRQLKRELDKLLRWFALDVARGKQRTQDKRVPDESTLRKVLGRPRFLFDAAERERPAGVAAGLAWTPVGGDVLYVETTKMAGKGKLEITGQLGDVMNESARAALAYVRAHAGELGIEPSFLNRHDLHVHVPAGGIPKDGPSAGVTMFTAFASLLSDRRVRPDTAMTGEATLRGRVLPVGGIKAKVLAAHRAGFERVIIPRRNEIDLDEVPQAALNALEIVLVDHMSEVLDAALLQEARTDTPTGEVPNEPREQSTSQYPPEPASPQNTERANPAAQ